MPSRIVILPGHVLATLPRLKPALVQTCITSPPYWGLRDYGTDPVPWPEVRYRPMPGLDAEVVVPGGPDRLGLEATPTAYVGHLVAVFREVARVLRKDGTLWLNLGQAFNAARDGGHPGGTKQWRPEQVKYAGRSGANASGFKAKDLLPLDWLVAFALQADGWYLRAWLPWVKRNPMPGSQRDRPTASCEVVFLLGHPESGGHYVYDHEAVMQSATQKPQRRSKPHAKRCAVGGELAYHPPERLDTGAVRDEPGQDSKSGTRTWRTADAFFGSLQAILDGGQGLLSSPEGDPLALVVNTQPYKGAHFAVFPPSLVEPCIKAGAPEHGCCPTCGTAWRRVTGTPEAAEGGRTSGNIERKVATAGERARTNTHLGSSVPWVATTTPTVGWRPGCSCPENTPVPCTVLDPFGGAGSTGLAAKKLGRRAILCELSDAYVEQQVERVRLTM